MKTDIQSQNPNDLITDRFQKHKGFFIINTDCIMTDNQVVTVRELYDLVTFLDGGGIEFVKIEFWHALIKDGWLKIIGYDIGNKVIVSRIHDMKAVNASCDWFLISEDVFENEIAI